MQIGEYPPFFGEALLPDSFLYYNRDMKYEHIVNYLVETAGESFTDAGLSDQRVNKLTEAGIAEALCRYICGMADDSGNDFFKMDEDGQMYVYNERYFELIPKETLLAIIVEVMKRKNVGIVYRMGSAKLIRDYVMDMLFGDERCRWEPNRHYLVFNNGVLSLDDMKLHPFDVKYKTDIVLDFDYVPGAHSALWDKVLCQTVPDEHSRQTFQQFCGCFLADRTEYKIEYICFVIGEGQNGKSIICKATINIFRPEVASSYNPDQLFKGQGTQVDYRLADVNGKIVNYCDDVSNKDFSGGEFKAFISGGEFTGRHPYSHRPTKVTKVPLMLCCANKMPPTTDDTEGYFRRFLIIVAPNHVDERDKDPMLEMKLKAPEVKSAIFNWILEGYKTFIKNEGKIDIASSVKEVVEEMKENSNSLRRWISEYGYGKVEPIGPHDTNWKSLKQWCQEYIAYCNDFGETPKNKSSVIDMFKRMELEKSRRADGMWYCMGVVEKKEEKKVEEDLPAFGADLSDDGLPF